MDPNTLKFYFPLTIAVLFSFLGNFCSCISYKSLNYSIDAFQPAVATWFGPPTGAATGGACGYEADILKPPYSAMLAAGNQALLQKGKGCGACYQVQCKSNPACSGAPVTVTITDECPGNCNSDPFHFDLSGLAFGAMAKPGQANQLRNAGRVNVQFQRVGCNYRRTPTVFKVDKGANPFFFAMTILFENGDGDVAFVEIQPAGSNQFLPMTQNFGANYKINAPQGLRGPFSIRLTESSKKSIVAQNVIPANWKPGQYCRSNVNFGTNL